MRRVLNQTNTTRWEKLYDQLVYRNLAELQHKLTLEGRPLLCGGTLCLLGVVRHIHVI